jgi:protein-L-isoaspartate(D-aspartate) O-methyltransferase
MLNKKLLTSTIFSTFLFLLVLVVHAHGQKVPYPNSRSDFKALRGKMVETQIKARRVEDPRVLWSMGKVERHLFVSKELQPQAYNDHPLPIGEGQTISQPYVVALMTELLELKGGEKVLEIGTGSGYQAAILAELSGEVYTIEIIESLASSARKRLRELGYQNIHTKAGDGYLGWPAAAPFDAIIVTAAPDHIPQPLLDQLKEGGRLVVPVGRGYQTLKKICKRAGKIETKDLIPVMFVPLTGEGVRHRK